MTDVKVSLTIELPGSTMLSKQECLTYSRKPILSKKTGKQVYKYGQPLYEIIEVEDPKKHHLNTLVLKDAKGRMKEKLHFYTRRCRPAYKTTHMSRECYLAMISTECPAQFRGPKKEWLRMEAEDRLKWHMENYAAAFNGEVISYTVYDD